MELLSAARKMCASTLEKNSSIEQGWIDVVKPLRVDSQELGQQPLSRRPILLARLPRLGEAVVQETPGPALAVVVEEVPEESIEKNETTTSYFVDSSHAVEVEEVPSTHEQVADQNRLAASLEEKKKKRQRRKIHPSHAKSSSRRSSSQSAQQSGLAALYCKIHQQLQPLAGSIVALALVAAAGLMYWMILAPADSSLPYSEMVNDSGELMPVEIPPFVPRTSPMPIPESTGMVEGEVEEALIAESPVAESASNNFAVNTEDFTSEHFTFQSSPLLDSPGLVAVPDPPAAKVAIKEDPPKIAEQAPQTVVEKMETPQAAVAAYESTGKTEEWDFSKVIAAGKGSLLGQPTGPAVTQQPTFQTQAPAQR